MASTQLTIFAAPRPFAGEFDRIQHNAIYSWTCLLPRPRIIAYGGGETAANACRALDVEWVEDIPTAPTGAPMLDALFGDAQRRAKTPLVAYVNPDIIL